jgi:hypothetical protein
MIDLPGLTYSSGGSASFNSNTNILTVTEGGNQYQQTLAGSYSSISFRVASDSGVGTLVTMASDSPCFVAGTLLLTERGEVAVESLNIGDGMRLIDGRIAQIVWIGHRWVGCFRHPHPRHVWPVRVRAGAFGPNEPRRDLFLSPDHAVFVEGVLVPIKHLINGAAIAQVKVATIMYYHVELASHEVLVAEGLCVESFLDTGNRSSFANGGDVLQLHPNFSTIVQEAMCFATLVVFGPEVERARERVRQRAAVVPRKTRRIKSG